MPPEALGVAVRLRSLREDLERGDTVPEGALGQLLLEVNAGGHRLAPAELEAVRVELDRLTDLIQEIEGALTEELAQVSQRRKSIQGYNHLRPIKDRQRLSRRA